MRIFMVRLTFLIIILGFSQPLLATMVSDGMVSKVRPDNWDVGGTFIEISGGTVGDAASCTGTANGSNSANSLRWYFLRITNKLYKEITAAAMLAKTTNSAVYVYGNGTCTGVYEDLRLLEIR